MKKILLILVLVINLFAAPVYCTVKIKGINTTTSGTVALQIGNNIPSGFNPSNTVWQSCKSNWVYIHKDSSGNLINDKYLDRMLSTALSSLKSNTTLRLAIQRDGSNNCYSSQIYDLGY